MPTFTSLYTAAYYTGSGGGASLDVPSKYPVALAGIPFQLDLKSEQYEHQSIPLLRQQADDSSSPSEASLNPDDLWRRAQDSWHHGAGQTFRDRQDGNPNRFRSSKGIDPWTRYQFKLHFDTDQKDASTDTNVRVIVAGARLYKVEGSAITYTTDVTVDSPTWNAVTYSGGAITGLASDGFHVWVTDGTNTYITNTGITTTAVHDALDTDVLAYVKGRLMAAHDNSIYDDTLAGTPAALFSQANTDFRWVGFAEGRAAIYAAGWSGDKSLIYRIAVKQDASGLDQPIIAGELPDGEVILGIGGYLGFIFLGSTKGVRFCIPDAQGNLEIGGLIDAGPVRCFEGQDSFVWFGWDNYDAVSTGLGRMDLRVITDPNLTTLAYASDLMVTNQGAVLSVATFQDIRVFTVSAKGVYAQHTNLVASGTIDSGLIGYGLPDAKTALFVDVRTEPLDGSYTLALASDNGAFLEIGAEAEANDDGTEFTAGEVRGERFELRLALARDAVTTAGPVVTRWTLKSTPQPEWREFIFWPLLLHETLKVDGDTITRDPAFDLATIKGFRRTRQLILAQEGGATYSVNVVDYQWKPHKQTLDKQAWNGTLLTKMQVIQ